MPSPWKQTLHFNSNSLGIKHDQLLKIYLILIAIPFILSGCSKQQSYNPPAATFDYEVLWQTPFVPNIQTDFSISTNPIIYENSVIVSSEYPVDGKVNPILFLDSATGELQEAWSDYINGGDNYSYEQYVSDGDYLLLSSNSAVDCINLQNRSSQWASTISGNSAYKYLFEGEVFTGISISNSQAAILKTPINQSNWETVFSFTKTDAYSPFFDSMGFGELANGNKVALWKNRSSSGNLDRTDIFAYDLTADSLLWRNTDFNSFGGFIPLEVEGGKVYGLVARKAFCLELSTGNTLWTNDFSGLVQSPRTAGFEYGMVYVTEHHVLYKGTDAELIMLMKKTGNHFKTVMLPGGMEDRETYFEGKLFFSARKLCIVDVATGELLIDPALSEKFGIIRSGITIDEDRRVMYFHNGKVLFCVKIPDTV